MRPTLPLAGVLALALAGSAPVMAEPPEDPAEPKVGHRVIVQPDGPTAGWLGLELSLPTGWHIYWTNPGQTGMATEVKATGLADTAKVGSAQFPVPERIVAPGDVVAFGYHDEVVVLMPYQGSGEVEIEAFWLICRETCVPQELKTTAVLSGPKAPSGQLEAARARLPKTDAKMPSWTDNTVALEGLVFPSAELELLATVESGRLVPRSNPESLVGLGGVVVRDGQGYTFTIPPLTPSESP